MSVYLKAEAESVSKLEARVRELERQRDWLAEKLASQCEHSRGGYDCYTNTPCPYSKGLCRCVDVEKEEWVQIVKEEAAKEAENGQRKD